MHEGFKLNVRGYRGSDRADLTYIQFARENGYLEHLRTQQAKYWMYETINQNLLDSFYKSDTMEQLIAQTEQRVLNNEISSFTAAYDLLKQYGNNKQ